MQRGTVEVLLHAALAWTPIPEGEMQTVVFICTASAQTRGLHCESFEVRVMQEGWSGRGLPLKTVASSCSCWPLI